MHTFTRIRFAWLAACLGLAACSSSLPVSPSPEVGGSTAVGESGDVVFLLAPAYLLEAGQEVVVSQHYGPGSFTAASSCLAIPPDTGSVPVDDVGARLIITGGEGGRRPSEIVGFAPFTPPTGTKLVAAGGPFRTCGGGYLFQKLFVK